MAEENLESAEAGSEQAQDTPTPEIVSQPGAGQQSSQSVAEALKPFTDQIAELTAQVRALQGDKDRGVAKVQKQVSNIEEVLGRYDELVRSGQKPEDARWRMEMEAQLREARGATDVLPQPASQPVAGNSEWERDRDELLKAYGVERNDPRFTEFTRGKQWTSHTAYVKDLAIWLRQQDTGGSTQRPAPSAGATVAPSSGGAAPSSDLMQEYERKRNELTKQYGGANQRSPTLLEPLFRLQEEYRKKGLAI